MPNFSTFKPSIGVGQRDYVTKIAAALDELDARFNTAATFGGTVTVTGAFTANGNTTIGNAAGDTLTIAPSAVTWSGNPTHSGNHTFSGSMTLSSTSAAMLVGESTAKWGSTILFEMFGTNKTGAFVNDTAATTCLALVNRATSGDNVFAQFATETGITIRGSIDYNRGGGAVRFNTTSDEQVKMNRRAIGAAAALAVVDGIDAEEWDWDPRYALGAGRGFVAQKVHALAPEAVSPGSTDAKFGDEGYRMWAMDASKLVPYLWIAVKDLRVRVAALEGC